jgi:hypothetical protein
MFFRIMVLNFRSYLCCSNDYQIGLSTAYVLRVLYFGRLVPSYQVMILFGSSSDHYIGNDFPLSCRHSTDREVALMALMAYLSYMLAEVRPSYLKYVKFYKFFSYEPDSIRSSAQFLNLSGILTVFFCGIVMSHYAWHNVTESSRITTRCYYCIVYALLNCPFDLQSNC